MRKARDRFGRSICILKANSKEPVPTNECFYLDVKFFTDNCTAYEKPVECAPTKKRRKKDPSYDSFNDGLIVYDMLKHLQPALKKRDINGEEVIQLATRFEKLFSRSVIQQLIARHENPEEMLDVMLLFK